MCWLILFIFGNIDAPAQHEKKNASVDYTIVYLIHGDAEYLYHTASGKARQADKAVLEDAVRVAKEAKNGEIFIFHQRPERQLLGIFPKKDRRFLHFRNGELIRGYRYSPHRDSSSPPFLAESGLYQKYQSAQSGFQALLYFGHEVPEIREQRYHSSSPERKLSGNTFAEGIARFKEAGLFDLVALSTCNNGTPRMASLLSPHAEVLLASPQNLHLSHIDTRELKRLEQDHDISPVLLANHLANATFQRLRRTVQTVVSLSVYDLDAIQLTLHTFSSRYSDHLQSKSDVRYGRENIDCVNIEGFSGIGKLKGVDVYFRAPRFGTGAGIEGHSGFGCKPGNSSEEYQKKSSLISSSED